MKTRQRTALPVALTAVLAVALVLSLSPSDHTYADEDALSPRVYLPIVARPIVQPTPTPTLRPTPTQTPGPYPTPDGGSTPSQPYCSLGDLGFTSNQFVYSTWGQTVELNAELCNPLAQAYTGLKYQIDALNASGGIIESVVQTDYRVLWPGEFLCTNNYLSIKPPGVVSYRYTLLAKTKYTGIRRPISILNHSYDRTTRRLAGQLRNDDPAVTIDPWMSAALYDSQNRILLCDEFVTLNTYALLPNQVTSFAASFYVFNPDAQSVFDRVVTYRISISQ